MSLGPGAGIVLRVLNLALTLEGVATRVEWLGEERPHDVRPGQLVVLAARSKPRFTSEAVIGLGLRAPNGGPAHAHSQASRYGLYQFGPNPSGAAKGTTARSGARASTVTRSDHGVSSSAPGSPARGAIQAGRAGR
jgi:hypothetical protein